MAGNRIRGITVEIGGDTTKLQTVDILVSRNLDSGNMETGIPERKPSLIGLIKTRKKSNECQAQSRFAGHKPALHL